MSKNIFNHKLNFGNFSLTLKVDEIEEDNYNDANFWKGSSPSSISADRMEEIFHDLAIN